MLTIAKGVWRKRRLQSISKFLIDAMIDRAIKRLILTKIDEADTEQQAHYQREIRGSFVACGPAKN